MLNENILKILNKNQQILDLVKKKENFEVLIKKLSSNEVKSLKLYYPNFIEIDHNAEININNQNINQEIISSIISFTFVKNASLSKKYEKIKKIKIYIDELKEKIIKVLQN